jgi:hypothetical protein
LHYEKILQPLSKHGKEALPKARQIIYRKKFVRLSDTNLSNNETHLLVVVPITLLLDLLHKHNHDSNAILINSLPPILLFMPPSSQYII